MKQIRKRLTYANVMSSIAVFLVIGGGAAIAATQLPKNSVGPKQLKKSAVKTSKIGSQAVKAGKLAKNAVSTNRIRDNAVTGAKVNEATLGEVPLAATGAPRAYARVNPNSSGGGVDEQYSRGVSDASITFVGGSVYCFELGFTPKNINATVDWIGGGANTFAQATLQEFAICPEGTDASVRTTNEKGEGIANISFYVQFVG